MGSINGVCKHSDLVVVKTTLLEEDLTWAFDAVLTEIKSNKQLSNPQPAVVVFAGNSDPDPDVYPWFSVRMTMENMFEEDAVVVVSSGNNAPVRRDVDTLPAMWADVTFPLIVAGSVNNAGVESVFSQGLNYVTVWAPGENVQCAARNDFRKATGTSFATGMVAGLVAYGLALENFEFGIGYTAEEAKDWISGTAQWSRQSPQGRPVIWNTEMNFKNISVLRQ